MDVETMFTEQCRGRIGWRNELGGVGSLFSSAIEMKTAIVCLRSDQLVASGMSRKSKVVMSCVVQCSGRLYEASYAEAVSILKWKLNQRCGGWPVQVPACGCDSNRALSAYTP